MIGLLVTAAAVGYAIAAEGGIRPVESNIALALLGAAGVLSAALLIPSQSSGPRQSLALLGAISLLAYVGFQVVPLPLAVLKVLDPTRAEITAALSDVMTGQRFAPLTILPAESYVYLSRMAGYVLVFLTIRESVRRLSERPWIATIPLILFGGLESVLGFSQQSNAATVQGTYASSNHFAGFLEMVLPLSLMYGVAMIFRERARGVFRSSSLIKAAAVFVLVAGLFVAIVLSSSVMGVVSALGSLLVMGFTACAVWLTGGRRVGAVAGVALLAALLAYSVPTQELASEFGDLVVNRTTSGRAPIARDTLSIIGAYPLFGSGLGTYFPALLRYQTSLLDYAVLNAHNDYLQLLSELGVVGFLILSVLVGSVWIHAARAAATSADREVRLLALGCMGGLTAMLIHSVGDFNMYVPANAMVLAWIAGIAASLPEHGKRRDTPSMLVAAIPRIAPRSLQAFTLVVGCLLSLYAGTWLMFLNWYQGDSRLEHAFCRFGICDSNGMRLALERQHEGDLAAAQPAALHELLRRDPAGPYNWMDLGASLYRSGRTAEARASFSRALQLGPNIPFMLVRAGRFHFDLGERERAFELMSRALKGNPGFAQMVFSAYDEHKMAVLDVVGHGLPPVPAVWVAYLESQINQQRVEESSFLWTQIIQRGYATDRIANQITTFLNDRKNPAAAVQAWAAYAGGRTRGYPDAERVFNGDFESETTASMFDWRIARVRGAVVGFDRKIQRSGDRALRIDFDGTSDPMDLGVSQVVYLQPGWYRLRAYIRTDGVSTDEGVRLGLTQERRPGMNVATRDLRGSNDWTLIEQDFETIGGLARVSVIRRRSFRFDRFVKGTVWVDQVSISPTPSS